MAEREPSLKALLAQHERALSLLCGLHACVTIDGPPETVAERIFDEVMAERRDYKQRIARLESNLSDLRSALSKSK